MSPTLKTIADNHRAAVDGFLTQSGDQIVALAEVCSKAIANDKKLLFCGNGGSACDAMHIAGEFVGRYVNDRRALPAIALSADTGIITAVANDYNYDYIFARQVEALGQAGDVLIALSTSGKSPNVLRALDSAKKKAMITVLFSGEKLKKGDPVEADFIFIVPSLITAHVQEAHMVAMHGLASLIEAVLFPAA
ncbi:MAG: D-sedoheptulose-7-phosphate isomerase [Rickettsiales bacterium]